VRVVWQYGLWTAISTLLLKVPEQELTFVILGNTDALSAPYRLGGGDLASSPWAREFLDRFVIGSQVLPSGRLGASSEGGAQQPASGVWGAAPHGSIEEWEGLVVAWFDQSFAADNKVVLVDSENRLNGILKAQTAKGGTVPLALGSSVAPCKSAIRQTCVAPGEAILRFAPVRRQQWSGSEERWGTAVTVVLLEGGMLVSRIISVQLEGKLEGPVRVISAWTRSH